MNFKQILLVIATLGYIFFLLPELMTAADNLANIFGALGVALLAWLNYKFIITKITQ